MTTNKSKVTRHKKRHICMESVQLHILYNPWNSSGQNTGLGNCSLSQGIFPTQGSNPGLLHCKGILYQLSYQGRHIYIWLTVRRKSQSTEIDPELTELLEWVGNDFKMNIVTVFYTFKLDIENINMCKTNTIL